MYSLDELYKQSSLSFAAYADLFGGIRDASYIDALEASRMTKLQAESFAETWAVIDQHTDISGASVTVFEEIETGQRHLAIRGTDSPGDITADGLLAIGFPQYLNPQFVGLRGAVQDWIDNGTLTADFSITGHSLGGYLGVALINGVRLDWSQDGPVCFTEAQGWRSSVRGIPEKAMYQSSLTSLVSTPLVSAASDGIAGGGDNVRVAAHVPTLAMLDVTASRTPLQTVTAA